MWFYKCDFGKAMYIPIFSGRRVTLATNFASSGISVGFQRKHSSIFENTAPSHKNRILKIVRQRGGGLNPIKYFVDSNEGVKRRRGHFLGTFEFKQTWET